jgi:hypothetical protein
MRAKVRVTGEVLLGLVRQPRPAVHPEFARLPEADRCRPLRANNLRVPNPAPDRLGEALQIALADTGRGGWARSLKGIDLPLHAPLIDDAANNCGGTAEPEQAKEHSNNDDHRFTPARNCSINGV